MHVFKVILISMKVSMIMLGNPLGLLSSDDLAYKKLLLCQFGIKRSNK